MTRETHLTDDQPRSVLAKLLRPKVAIPLFLVFLILISPWLSRGWFLRGVPDPPEPFDATPLLEYTVPDDENAFTDYRLAMSLYIPPSRDVSNLRDQVALDGWHLANDDVRQFLHDNEDALFIWKKGTEKDRALYIPINELDEIMMQELAQDMQEFHLTAMLLCRQLEAESEPREAWQWYRAAIRAGRHLGTKGAIYERMVGASLFESTVVQITEWAADPRLTSADLRLALEQLRQDWKLTEQTSTVMQIEYLMFSRSLKEHPELLAEDYGSQPEVAPKYWYFVGEPELSERLMRFYFHNQIQFCDLPSYQRPRFVPRLGVFDDPTGFTINDIEWSQAEYRSAYERSLLAGWLFGEIEQLYVNLDREEAKYYTALEMLAGEAFRRDHGRPPNTRNELVPEYLDASLIDHDDSKP